MFIIFRFELGECIWGSYVSVLVRRDGYCEMTVDSRHGLDILALDIGGDRVTDYVF